MARRAGFCRAGFLREIKIRGILFAWPSHMGERIEILAQLVPRCTSYPTAPHSHMGVNEHGTAHRHRIADVPAPGEFW
jgi:hypothetical protein